MKAKRPQASHPREALTREPLHDSYHAAAKLHGPAECPACHASYRAGRWSWARPAADALPHRCPACARIDDDMPAGYVALKGSFLPTHRVEILGVVKARETHARAEHPLQRIMAVETTADGMLVTTTDVHLARGIAHAVHQAFKGELAMRYSKAENLLRATWKR